MNTISLEELTAIETRNREARDLFWAQYRLTIGTGTEADLALVEDQEVTGTVTMGSPQPPVCLSATELDALLGAAKLQRTATDARDAALEEAASLCENASGAGELLAEEIRSLKGN